MNHKIIFITIAVFLMSARAYAQLESVELFVGPSRTYTSEPASTFAYRPLNSLSIGVGTRFKLNTRSGLATKLLFEERGIKGNYIIRDVNSGNPLIMEATYKINVKYLTLPVLYSLRFGHKVVFMFDIGPHLAFQLTRSTDISGSNNHNDDTLQFGLTTGFSMEIPTGKHFGFTVGLLDNLGLYAIGDDVGPPYVSVLNLLFGARYNLVARN